MITKCEHKVWESKLLPYDPVMNQKKHIQTCLECGASREVPCIEMCGRGRFVACRSIPNEPLSAQQVLTCYFDQAVQWALGGQITRI